MKKRHHLVRVMEASMVLGITGGIASGKSMVTEFFRDLGAAVVSADILAREVVQPGTPALRRIAKRFGPEVLTPGGELDRDALAGKIFSDENERQALNDITHPAIADLAEKRLAELGRQGLPLVVYEAPLLFEAGAQKRVDAVLVVTVETAVQLRRLMARDGIDEEQARRKVAAQMPQAEKAARADFVIDNSGPPEQARRQVEMLFQRLVAGNSAAGQETPRTS